MTTVSEIDFDTDSSYVQYLDKGFVGLVDTMGTDESIVQAARVSYGEGTKGVRNDEALIRYLIRHRHTSPIEMCDVKFHLKMPIFIMRQFVRHRTASLNEYSGRYSVMVDEFYIPDDATLKPQSESNKQGREGTLAPLELEMCRNTIKRISKENYKDYVSLLGDNPDDNYNFVDRKGLSRELARMILPLNNYTEVYWKCNLHNFFHLIDLRSDSHAQWEIQELSKAMYDLVKPRFPLACKAFEDYIMYGVNLSSSEVNVVKELIRSVEDSGIDVTDLVEKEIKSPRESKEFLNKF